MSDFYQKFRSEIAAGGATDEKTPDSATRSGALTGVIMLVFLGYLCINSPWTAVFVFGLLVSIFLHEVGHFSTARLTGMKVTQFFMGFGPRVWSTTRGEVEYGLRALPLGAFVRIIGMNNLDEVEQSDESRSYRAQTFPRRLLVITAGSLMHMVIAFVLFASVFSISGREQQTGITVIKQMSENSPASVAGLKTNDEIRAIAGVKVSSYETLVSAITSHAPGDVVSVETQRDGQINSVDITLAQNPNDATKSYLGVFADDWKYKKLAIASAAWQSTTEIGRTIVDSVKGVTVALNPMNSIRHLTKQDDSMATRPTTLVGVSQVGGQIGRSDGLKGVLLLLASINVFVGVFNMFPLLPFDGGHAAVAIYERIRSRRGIRYSADISKMVPLATAVVGILALLLVTGLYLDITQPLG